MFKRTIIAAALGALSSGALAADKWDGGDDLATNPLGCDGSMPAMAAKPYDGGQPASAPDRMGKAITVVDVPKLVGICYFAATTESMRQAADLVTRVVHRRSMLQANLPGGISPTTRVR